MQIRFGTALLLAASCLLPLPLCAQDYIVWSGGAGLDERATAPTQGTRLVFFAEKGEFVANVKVQVSDAGDQQLVDTVVDGPWLILNLPAGRYRVQAQLREATQGGVINVDGSNQEFGFQFRLQP